ncbi:MAG: hypothetical protein J6Y86_07455 [Pseudobutyrivibrio sp.]|nr:hypothetical protein [Pseudobutyrivibrio sp.]
MSLIQPTSRVEDILKSKIDGTTYDKPPLSRVEALLLELEPGGGGTDNYNELTNKPSINGNVLVGDQSTEDLGLSNWDDV